MRYDYITNGQRVEIVEAAIIGDVMHPLSSIRLMSDEERAALGILDHVVPLAEAKAERLAALANERWRRTQAFSYDGETDVPADSAANIVNSTLSLRDRRGVPAEAVQNWQLKKPDVFRSWNYDELQDYGFAVADHIQACFDRARALADLINAAEDRTALDAIDITADWP